MIAALIRSCIANRAVVILVVGLAIAAGTVAVRNTPLDAIPDLSDVQVIVRTIYPGQAPQVVEDQVTYPLTTTLMSVPHARVVRGYSMFGESFVYVLFEDGTDLYWARSRVLEYLSQVQSRLPAAARSALGPDATGVGWIYEYALIDRTGKHDVAELRALQDWFLKYELKSVRNVAEVATIGGFGKQYQIVLLPDRLRAYDLTVDAVVDAVAAANAETGGSVIELAEAEYMVRMRGYLDALPEFESIPVATRSDGTPILLRDVANIELGGEIRRGIAELDGQGEVTGGVIVLRAGENARETIALVKEKLARLAQGLPEGVEIVETYDRSKLIDRAVANLWQKLAQEFVVVALVCTLFLWHVRSALVAVITLPVGILIAFIVMRGQGINADIMSLGGIAIAIGAMVDAAVVMVENAHKKLEAAHTAGVESSAVKRLELLTSAVTEVAPALFVSLLIITLSFVPVFMLEAQEGRLFAPLAYTKTYAMAAAAALSITLIPVLIVLFVRGRITAENANPVNRVLVRLYRPVIKHVLDRPLATVALAVVVLLGTAYPVARLGTEFMPPLEEGDLLYMPTALPGLAVGKAAELLQQTDRMIRTFPEVEHVFGKAGRADSATDPAPLEMFETTIKLKDKSEWRPGMTTQRLIEALDAALAVPGLANVWVQPIRNRIDMLATGIKSPIGIKIAGPDLTVIERIGARVETVLEQVPGTASAFAERVSGGRYIEIIPDRAAAGRYGLSIAAVERIVALAIGGENIGETVEGLQRFPINVRYPREIRDSLADLDALPIVTAQGATITLGTIAKIRIADGPPMIKSENARPNGWVYVDIRDRDIGSWVQEARDVLAREIDMPLGYSLAISGQYEYLARAAARLAIAVPFTLAVVLVLLYVTFRNFPDALLVMASVPFALVGGFWFIYVLGHALSVASAVGFIALAGLAAEFGVVMLIYLDRAVRDRMAVGELTTTADLRAAIIEGAVMRVRPKAMTVAVVVAGLVPLFVGSGTGSEVMQRIAAPMIGGMLTAPLLSMIVLPAGYFWLQRLRLEVQDDATGAP